MKQEIEDYLLWMMDKGYAHSTWRGYEWTLKHFLNYIGTRKISFEAAFTSDILKAFQKKNGLALKFHAVTGLSRYLFEQKKIPRPIQKQRYPLPQIYEEYLIDYESSRQVQPTQILRTRRTLSALNDYLEKRKIDFSRIRIEQLDDFLAKYAVDFAPVTQQNIRSCLRGFLRYLWQERKVKRDLASFFVGGPYWSQTKPPKFLRSQEVQRLFAGLKLCTPKELRLNAMLRLAYTLGLRPKEISSIRLDDISFRKGEITLRERKSSNPMKLPLPEDDIKAIAAYIVGARPKSDARTLFLKFRAPYTAILPVVVSQDIGLYMRSINLPSSAYWLRHTYAQNLLEAGASTFEIKQMLGHDRIQTTKRYIHIHTKLMREVLFNETL
ncbi:MAG: hypothetical protein IEMM0006_2177 [bacterium]|nr:MAG: hypothetical protein IEMM0006_2177 [bacterium]